MFPLAIAHLAGLGAVQLALLCLLFDWRLSIVPLVLYLVLCAVAPFVPRLNFFLPIITRGNQGGDSVAITFDDGPDPKTTPLLLDLLKKKSVRAAFFVVGEKAKRYPEIIRRIIKEGHEVGNHTNSHDVFLALRSRKRLREQITKCSDVLEELNIRPLAFRPPVGITNPRMWPVLLELGMFCVGFTSRAGDFGNRKTDNLAQKILYKTRPSDIILLHDCPPLNSSTDDWLEQLEQLLDGLKKQNFQVKTLSELIGRPAMSVDPKGDFGAVRSFYDGLAHHYDAEQQKGSNGAVRNAENEMIEKFINTELQSESSVLEIGAGTGRHTLKIADKVKAITAVDISPDMLAALEQKASGKGVGNVKSIAGDIMQLDFDHPFDLICSLSCFEYFRDMDPLFQKIHTWLKPGGLFFFTTSHRSFFRFFAQLGNAMRQGVWLHARSISEIKCSLERAGFKLVTFETAGLRSAVSKGVLVGVLAQKNRHN